MYVFVLYLCIQGISEIIGVIVAWYFVVRTERKWMWSGWFNILAAFVSWIGLLIPDTREYPHFHHHTIA